MRITLVAVGRLRDAHAEALCADYAARIPHFLPFSVTEVKDGRGLGPDRAREAEGSKLLGQLPDGCLSVLLDERGTRRTSVGLAHWIRDLTPDTRDLRFVLGGPFGVDAAVKARASESLRLSDLTLPHELARVLFLEQLYRACTILRGTKYHHE